MDKTTGIPAVEVGGVPSQLKFPVVGLGASAGGLVALKRFIEHLPADTDMAFVVVMHLSPKHESTADELLARCTRMPVTQVHSRVPIERNNVYVISPSSELRMDDGHLEVVPAHRPRGQAVAIDRFFRTLADVHRDGAIAIVLSGSGANGAVGVTRIKELGGVTFAQSPDDADYDDMPRAAISTGRVDMVLPVVEMPTRLLELWDNAREILLPPAPETHGHILHTPPDTRTETEDALREILDLQPDAAALTSATTSVPPCCAGSSAACR